MAIMPHSDQHADAPRRRSGPIGRAAVGLFRGLTTLGLVALAAFVGGFIWFARSVADEEAPLRENADGIVVLTGGASRITDAVDLLAAGHGKRLLITGVHRSTSSREISRMVSRHERLLACCVDLDYSAVNTHGNAEEARRWAKQRGFRSLVIVTSNYHMPRSMAELARQLPDVRLIPFVVVSDKMRTEPWWSSTGTARLLASEYMKYVVAQLRMRIEPVQPPKDVARARTGSRS
ncbi:MAG: hypothetical protein QOD74_2348 [Variibacter sp.]|jgi:uncharacterized SAM-binding protein YcdF (DUF218 family)|nr:hypothetical protein [Variibacter sp.]